MPCYHPLTGLWYGERTSNGNKKYLIQGGLDPYTKYHGTLDQVSIPCGQCIGCRLDYSRQWADRMTLEYETSDHKAIFITLTYRDEDAHWKEPVPDTGEVFATLDKRDCQLFMKSLRDKFSDRRIRFYLAGEYGPTTKRPHYHAILFGLELTDFSDRVEFRRNELGQMWYVSSTLTDIWKRGYTLLCDVSYKCFAYVSRYVTKKLNGDLFGEYIYRDVIPEFSLMSRKPGIGREYLDLHPDCLDYKTIHIPDPVDPLHISVPKYFLRQLKNENSSLYDKERYDKMCEERRQSARDSVLAEMQKTSLTYLDYLEIQEIERKHNASKVLRRRG